MFGTTYFIYMGISFALTAVLVYLGKRFLKTDAAHNMAIRIVSIITVLIHISPLWVDYLKNGSAEVESVMLFPIHPCNVCMWLLVISTVVKRDTVAYRLLSEFVCIGGTVCGFVGLVFNENFGNNPTLADWDIFKGLLSHSTMILGTIYLGASGLVKIRLRGLVSVVSGLLLFVINGALINGIYTAAGLGECNSMYLQSPPFDALPWLTTPVIGVAAIAVTLIFTSVFEKLATGRKWKEIFTFKNLFDLKPAPAIDGESAE